MEADANALKTLVLLPIAIFMSIIYVASKPVLKLNTRFAFIIIAYLLIVIHYALVGYSINQANSILLIYGGLTIVSGLSIKKIIARGRVFRIFQLEWLSVFLYIFVIYNLVPFIKGSEGESAGYSGAFQNPNILGGYLGVVCLPYFLNTSCFSINKTKKICASFFLALTIFLILMTRSRAAILVVFFVLNLLLFKFSNFKKYIKSLIFIALTLTAIFVLAQASSKYDDVGLLSTRELLYAMRMSAISERPWFGWGFNADVNNSYDRFNEFPPMEKGNTILQIMEEFGAFLGGLILCLITFFVFKIIKKSNISGRNIYISGTFLACSVHLMMETWLFNFTSLLSMYFWLLTFYSLSEKNLDAAK